VRTSNCERLKCMYRHASNRPDGGDGIRGAELAEPKSWNVFTASRGDPSAVPPNHLPAKAGLHCTNEVASVQLIAHNLLNHGVGCVSRLFLTCHFSGFSSSCWSTMQRFATQAQLADSLWPMPLFSPTSPSGGDPKFRLTSGNLLVILWDGV
jgi:hypothetical protein